MQTKSEKAVEESSPTEPAKDACDRLIEQGEIIVKIGKILKPFNDETRRRIVRTVAAYYDIPVEGNRR